MKAPEDRLFYITLGLFLAAMVYMLLTRGLMMELITGNPYLDPNAAPAGKFGAAGNNWGVYGAWRMA